jgi:hypothetical protein
MDDDHHDDRLDEHRLLASETRSRLHAVGALMPIESTEEQRPPGRSRPWVAVGLAVAVPLIALFVVLGLTHSQAEPRLQLGRGALQISHNWAGYVATGARFTSVSATWLVPAVRSGTQPTELAAVWVGLDGRGTRTLEQIGTASGLLGGSYYYAAWYEIVPSPPVYLSMPIKPGDSVTASVTYGRDGLFTLVLRDNTSGGRFAVREASPGAELVTAEVVVEAPGTMTGLAPLPDFGKIGFTNARANGRPIGTFAWDRMSMNNGFDLQAAASALDADAASFTVDWHHE